MTRAGQISMPENGIASVERFAIAPRLLRLKDAAEYLSMGTKMLRHLINSGKLSYVQLGTNSPFLVDRRDLDEFIERHKIGAQ
ncbi:MAG: helix-turn-helix domain-containing protein [Candidatus Sulfotelmatobacter sp.]